MAAELINLSWPAIKAAADEDKVVIVPIGAIEQHGPHLPIDTDAYLAGRLALGGAEEFGAVVAPTVCFGCRSRPLSGGGELFPGTWCLSGETFVGLVRDFLKALIGDGFRRILVYSWHMENGGFAYEAARQAVDGRSDLKVVVMEQPFDSLSEGTMKALFPGEFPGWPLEHAGVLETSLMLHLRPDSVGPIPTRSDRLEWRPYEVLPEEPLAAGRTGVLWDAQGSGAEGGRSAYADIVAALTDVLAAEFGEPAAEAAG